MRAPFLIQGQAVAPGRWVDEVSIRAGRSGILNVMRALGMLRASGRRKAGPAPFVWTRAPESGLLRTLVALGARVKQGETLGYISDPYSGTQHPVTAVETFQQTHLDEGCAAEPPIV